MKRYIKSSDKILYPDVTELMVIVFNNEYCDLNEDGRVIFDKDYPGWSNTDNIRKYFYNAFEIDSSIKSLFRLADNKDLDALEQALADLDYLGGEYPYEKWLIEKLILAVKEN